MPLKIRLFHYSDIHIALISAHDALVLPVKEKPNMDKRRKEEEKTENSSINIWETEKRTSTDGKNSLQQSTYVSKNLKHRDILVDR